MCRNRRQPRRPARRAGRGGFTLMEVLVALAVLSIALVALHKAFSSTVYVNNVSAELWRAIRFSNNELARWEREPTPNVSVQQGTYEDGHPMAGYAWKREVVDEEPFPGVKVRKLQLELRWEVAGVPQVYRSEIYVSPR